MQERVDVVAELEERRRVERELLKKQWHGKGKEDSYQGDVISNNCGLDVIFLKFYFVAFQYLCHVEDVDRHLRYPPVEMALMEYSLKEGRQKVWHTLIHPGKALIHYSSPTALSTLAKQYSLARINNKVMSAATLKTILKISYSTTLPFMFMCNIKSKETISGSQL